MTNRGSIARLSLGLLFAGAVVVYSFTQPFQSEAVRSAIPYGATFVFKADRLDDLTRSPVRGQLDHALCAESFLQDIEQGNGWTRLAAASEITVADIPFRSVGAKKSWAVASWVGWRSPWLRWKLEHSRDRRLVSAGKHNVWPIWRVEHPDLPKRMTLAIALTDNLFLACLSENPTDIHLLIDTYDGRHPAARLDQGRLP